MTKWQLELQNSIKNYQELFKLLKLNCNLIKTLNIKNAPLLVTRSYVKRISKCDPKDPLLLQILPAVVANFNNTMRYLQAPLQEQRFNNIPGLIHKYEGRILILTNKACAIRCQYCFRKNFSYRKNIASGDNLQKIFTYISTDPSIKEVVLSGGDPLLASNNYFKMLLNMLSNIPHLTTIRIHSRVPIVLPSRLEPDLIKILTNNRFNMVIVTHCNHPNEINDEVAKYIKKLHKTNIILLNQSVLLKNVNDKAAILAKLSQKLFDLKILPYYVHTLDLVKGAEMFEVKLSQIKKIFAELITILPGYLVPKLVTEKVGAKSKILLNYHDDYNS